MRYTVGTAAYGYRALGDIMVFIFFGITLSAQENDTTIVVEEKDDSRVGFEVSRGLKSERVDDSANGRKAKRANDDRTYKKFLKREFKNNRR